jgi:23S rRNA (guanosine2251-2'-O)-methyltransferase
MRLVLVIHNVRSALNVGSMLRTAEGLGVYKVYLTGYTPYPEDKNDERLPHLRKRTALQIHKTALGAEDLNEFTPAKNVALIVGNEVNGIEEPVLKQVDVALQIPMSGHKESFNVAVAAGIAMYKLKHA